MNKLYSLMCLIVLASSSVNATSILDAQNNDGDTALHINSKLCQDSADRFVMAVMLLDYGARTDLKNNDGKTAAEIANEKYLDELKKSSPEELEYSKCKFIRDLLNMHSQAKVTAISC